MFSRVWDEPAAHHAYRDRVFLLSGDEPPSIIVAAYDARVHGRAFVCHVSGVDSAGGVQRLPASHQAPDTRVITSW